MGNQAKSEVLKLERKRFEAGITESLWVISDGFNPVTFKTVIEKSLAIFDESFERGLHLEICLYRLAEKVLNPVDNDPDAGPYNWIPGWLYTALCAEAILALPDDCSIRCPWEEEV